MTERIWNMSGNSKCHLLGADGKTLCGKQLKFNTVTKPESQIGYRISRTTFCGICKKKAGIQ